MLRSRVSRAGVVTVALLLLAFGAAMAGSPPLPLADASAWLQRIRDAGRCTSYQGITVFSDGASVSSARVMHFCSGHQQYESVESLDGKATRTLRQGDLVHTLWPDDKTVVIEQREPLGSFPALLQTGEFRVEEHYELRVLGIDRVAGFEANVLLLKPRDSVRFAQRLWSERETGLLLRADMIDADGTVMERVSFSELDLLARVRPEMVTRPMNAHNGWRVVRSPLQRTSLEAEGWAMVPPVAGFHLISTVRRKLDVLETAPADAAGALVLQAIYSDGLTHLSLFVEPYDPRRHARAMATRIGATYTMMRRHDDFWVTVMGDVPLVTLQQFVQALKRTR